MIKFENVSKSFGEKKVLDELNMTVPKGSIYALMGLNGAGKTTAIKHLAGYLIQDSGSITIDGENIINNEELKQRTVFIPDELFFFRAYSLKEMGRYYSRVYKRWNQERFEEMIQDFELPMKGSIGKFSKGMKKQAAFALSMASMPDYLILDEPVDGLDPIVRHKLWHYIMTDCADREMTVLVSSHNAKEMGDACDYVGILKDGQMKYEGSLLEVEDENLEGLFIEVLGGESYER